MKNYYRRIPIFLTIVFFVVVIGFTPSYFKSFFEIESIFHFHALPAVLWLIILIIQPVLFNIGKINIHRKVGLMSLIIAFLVFSGSLMIIDHMLKVSFDAKNTDYQLAFSSINLSIGFLVYVALAYYHRKNIHLHSRYMISTAFFALAPGLIRLFDVSIAQNTSLTYSICIVLIFILILIDYKKKKVYLPYLILLVWFSLIAVFFPSIHEWDWWRNLVDSYRLF